MVWCYVEVQNTTIDTHRAQAIAHAWLRTWGLAGPTPTVIEPCSAHCIHGYSYLTHTWPPYYHEEDICGTGCYMEIRNKGIATHSNSVPEPHIAQDLPRFWEGLGARTI